MTYPWNAGEVLAAADLNAELASKLPYSYGTATPSTTTDGFLWYDENDTPPTPKFWDGSAFQNVAPAGGLELITAETFSAVSSVSVNSCFTSSYDHYRVVLTCDAASGVPQVRIRFRVSGSDNTTTNYSFSSGGILMTNGAADNGNDSAASSAFLCFAIDVSSHVVLDILNPHDSRRTSFLGLVRDVNGAGSSYRSNFYTGIFNATTSFDGFSLFLNTSTFSGTLRVYGYKD